MAYAAFAKVDPRLLAQSYGADRSASIEAAGKAVGGALEGLGQMQKSIQDKEKEDKEQARKEETYDFINWQRTQEVQKAYNDFQEKKSLIKSGDLEGDANAEFIPPPGYTIEGGQIIRETEVQNIAAPLNGTKKTEPKEDSNQYDGTGTPKKGQVIVTPDGEEIIVGDANRDGVVNDKDKGIYEGPNGLNNAFPGGQYGRGATTVTQAKKRKGVMGAASNGLSTLKDNVTRITNEPGYDADANTELTSLATAVDNDAVHVVYNSTGGANGEGGAEYVWQDADGKWHRMSADGLVKTDGTIDPKRLNGGQDVSKIYTNADLTNSVLNSRDLELSTAVKALTSGEYIRPEDVATYSQTIMTKVEDIFAQNPTQLASYNKSAEVVDLDGDGDIDAADASAHFYGTLSERPMFKGTLEQKAPISTAQHTEAVLGQTYNGIVTNISNKNTAYFTNLGFKNVKFNDKGQLTYQIETTYEDEGAIKTKLETVTVTNKQDILNMVRPAVTATYTGKDKASILGGIDTFSANVLKPSEEEEAAAAEPVALPEFINTVIEAVDNEDVAALTGGRVVNVELDTFGNEFTITLDTGAELHIDPDNEYDMKRYRGFFEGKTDEQVTASVTTELEDIPIN